MHVLGLEFGSASQLSRRLGSVWNCLWGNALKRSPGIIRKSRVSYPGPGFLASATWPSLPKKHYNGLNQTNLLKCIQSCHRAFVTRYTQTSKVSCSQLGKYNVVATWLLITCHHNSLM